MARSMWMHRQLSKVCKSEPTPKAMIDHAQAIIRAPARPVQRGTSAWSIRGWSERIGLESAFKQSGKEPITFAWRVSNSSLTHVQSFVRFWCPSFFWIYQVGFVHSLDKEPQPQPQPHHIVDLGQLTWIKLSPSPIFACQTVVSKTPMSLRTINV